MGNNHSKGDSPRTTSCISGSKEESYGSDDRGGQPNQIVSQTTKTQRDLPIYSTPHDTSDFYNMQHRRRGIFMILDNSNFLTYEPRKGSNEEVKQLKNAFSKLGFEVRHEKDLNKMQVISTMRQVAQENHWNCDCFAMVVLSHGDEGDTVRAQDGGYYTYQLYELFNGNVCDSLRGKPKLFFFNACKGNKEDQVDTICVKTEATKLEGSRSGGRSDSEADKMVTFHAYADFLCGFSTWQGYKSYRHKEGGSLYIHYLCEQLLHGADRGDDLTTMLTRVSRRMAESPAVDGKKILRQTSFYHSSLTKKVVFRPKTAVM